VNYLILGALVLGSSLLGTSFAYAQNDLCKLSSPSDVLACALSRDPEVRLSEASVKQGEELASAASQLPNPELATKIVSGNSSTESFTNAEINLAFNVEIGGKRSARKDLAEAQKKIIAAQNLGAKESVYIKVLTSLYRLRQLNDELEILNAAINNFDRVEKQYRQRPRLSPDQQASLGILKTASAEIKLRKAPLATEAKYFEHEIEHSIAQEFQPSPALLPKFKEKWPKIALSKTQELSQGFRRKEAEGELFKAQAELSSAQGSAWPDLKIGPTFERQTQGSQSYNAFGINLAFPLPVFNTHGGQRRLASLGVARSEMALKVQQTEDQHQREFLATKYQNAVEALGAAPSLGEVLKRHHESEALFFRGLISSSLLIESHRQLFEFAKTRNEQELAAVEAWAQFAAHQGTLFEEGL
jgi:cobalt-zinc-cadmium efflux system outer membrane protein